LDEKRGGVFFFSHKSFQEFLVAEYIANEVDAKTATIKDIVDHITDEVFDFLIEQDDEHFFRTFMSALAECKSGFKLSGVLALCRSLRMYEMALLRNSISFSSWDAAILLGSTEKAGRKPTVLVTGINTLIILGVEKGLSTSELVLPITILLFARAELDLKELSRSVERRSRADTLRDLVFNVISARWAAQGQSLLMRMDTSELVSGLAEHTSYPANISEVSTHNLGAIELPFDDFVSELPAASRRSVKEFYERDAETVREFRD
jgi:hypothetical protein